MPVYTYRREDGTTFDIRQSYQDDPLTHDPETGQKVVRLIHNTGVIFKGSGFYVNDSKGGSKSSSTSSTSASKDTHASSSTEAKETKTASDGDSGSKPETTTSTAAEKPASKPATPATS
jgi:predicted nucleic acid-binding Zn ribbon protein